MEKHMYILKQIIVERLNKYGVLKSEYYIIDLKEQFIKESIYKYLK
jgi:hypothetical protein